MNQTDRREPTNPPLHVLKFGGTSVGDAEGIARVVEIVRGAAVSHRVIVVVSAASGVTNLLMQAADVLSSGSGEPSLWLDRLERRHEALAASVLRDDAQARYRIFLRVHLAELARILDRLKGQGSALASRDAVLATGERVSTPLVAAALCEAGLAASPVDAAPLIQTDTRHGAARVDGTATRRAVRQWYAGVPERAVPVVTGFIGAAPNKATTTLGRGGSDYTAALLAAALDAAALERWTDVDGLYSEDPCRNAEAQRLHVLALDEAQAWNRAGRLGMHDHTLDPLIEAGIPLRVRSTRVPEGEGTWLIPASLSLPASAATS